MKVEIEIPHDIETAVTELETLIRHITSCINYEHNHASSEILKSFESFLEQAKSIESLISGALDS